MLHSLKGKMIIVISLLILLLIGTISFLLYDKASELLENSVLNNAKNGAKQNAQIITQWLEGTANELNSLANTPAIQSMQWSEQLPVLEGTLKAHDDYEMMYVVNKSGMANFSTGGGGDLSDREYFKEAMKTGRVAFSDPIISRATNARIIAIAQPIFKKGEQQPIGLVAATVKLGYLQNRVKNMQIKGHGYGWIIDNEMDTVAHPVEKYLGNKDILSDGNQELRDIAKRMAQGDTGTAQYELNGVDKLMAFAPVNLTGWSISMGAEVHDVMSELDIIRNISLLAVIIGLLLGIIITYFIAIYIANPIVTATEHAEIIAQGDFTKDIPESLISRNDEIGNLGNSFQEMTQGLRKMIGQVREIANNVAASSEELSASGDELGRAAEQVGTAIQDVASGAEEQSAQLEETTANVQNLMNRIQEVDNMSEEMDRQADQVIGDIDQGNQSIINSIEQVEKVKVNSVEVANNINSLGEMSNKIGDIVDMINGISEQTNLLALNAAIEAARAGEAGRGFSVVADEIRELAEESSSATDQIAGLIKDIQNSVAIAVDKMNNTESVVEDSVSAIKVSGEAFNKIQKAAQNLERLIEEITNRTTEMSDNSNGVEKIINDVAKVSQEAASNAEEVAASSEEQNAATEEIVSSANELARVAEDLTQTVDKFII